MWNTCNQQWISKFKHLISVWIREHFNWQILSPQRGQLERDKLPQIEQYLREGQRGLPALMVTKLGSFFSSRPSSWITLRRLRFRFSWHSFFTLLMILFSFLSFLVLPSSSNTSWSSNSAILSGSSQKSSSKYISLSWVTALRCEASTLRRVPENLFARPPCLVLTAPDIYSLIIMVNLTFIGGQERLKVFNARQTLPMNSTIDPLLQPDTPSFEYSLQFQALIEQILIILKMRKLFKGLILVCMMFGHNYVLNQAQALQEEIQTLHNVNVPTFNLLYSVPSAISIIFIIPLGYLYDRYSQHILLLGAFMLLIGQILVTIFGPLVRRFSYSFLVVGRTLEGTGAQVLYMIQGNLVSSWMGKFAGLTFILPEIGEIANVFITPIVSNKLGIGPALLIGLATCVISYIACLFLYCHLSEKKLRRDQKAIQKNSPNDNDNSFSVSQNQLKLTNTKSSEGLLHSKVDENSPDEDKIVEEADNKFEQNEPVKNSSSPAPDSIWQGGEMLWWMIALCAINECLYFPFLDNAKVLIQTRFCVYQTNTGFFLCLPFIAAIVTTSLMGKYMLHKFSRQSLIFLSSLLPLSGHILIYFISNCKDKISVWEEILLACGFILFGMGLGAYYSVSFSAIGLTVPESIRGSAYACLCFFQTLSMTAVPLVSGYIIEEDSANNDNYIRGYKNSSFLFICLCLIGVVISLIVMKRAGPLSFQYDDEESNDQQEDMEELQDSEQMNPPLTAISQTSS